MEIQLNGTKTLNANQTTFVFRQIIDAWNNAEAKLLTAKSQWEQNRFLYRASKGRDTASMAVLESRIFSKIGMETDLLLSEPTLFSTKRPDGEANEAQIEQLLQHVCEMGGLMQIIPELLEDVHLCNLFIVRVLFRVESILLEDAKVDGPFAAPVYERINPDDFIMYPDNGTPHSAVLCGHLCEIVRWDLEEIIRNNPKLWSIEPYEVSQLPERQTNTQSNSARSDMTAEVFDGIYRGPLEEGGEIKRYRILATRQGIVAFQEWDADLSPYAIGKAKPSPSIYDCGSRADQLREIDDLTSVLMEQARIGVYEKAINTFLCSSGTGGAIDATVTKSENNQIISVRNARDIIPVPKNVPLAEIAALLQQLSQAADANSQTSDTMSGAISGSARTATENQQRIEGAGRGAKLSMRYYEPALVDIAKLTMHYLRDPARWKQYAETMKATFELTLEEINNPYIYCVSGLSGRLGLQNRIASVQMALQIIESLMAAQIQIDPWVLYSLVGQLLADVLGQDGEAVVQWFTDHGTPPTEIEKLGQAVQEAQVGQAVQQALLSQQGAPDGPVPSSN